MTDTDRPREVSATLGDLIERARELADTGRRQVLGITGAPGAGKSTLAAALSETLGDHAALVGMDGFHLTNAELVRLGRRDRKGAPDTFDLDGYVALLSRLRVQTEGVIYAPVFDRGLEESIGSAVPVPADVPLVITEGNYLLLSEDGWAGVRPLLDQSWYLDVPAQVLQQRLVARRRSYGHGAADAAAWVRDVDTVNAGHVQSTREYADLIVTVIADL